MREKFPSLQDQSWSGPLLLHQSYHGNVSNAVSEKLRAWANANIGELLAFFPAPHHPEQLALVLADLLLLFVLNSFEEKGTTSLPATMEGFHALLSNPQFFKQSHNLLSTMLGSFAQRMKNFENGKSVMELFCLKGQVRAPSDEDFCEYFETILDNNSH